MKQFVLLLTFLAAISLPTFAQIPAIKSQKCFSVGYVEGTRHINVDATSKVHLKATNGNTIVAGSTTTNTLDVFIAELNKTNDTVWKKSYGGSLSDYLISVQPGIDGGYIVTATAGSSNGDVTGSHGGYEAWVLKLNDQGDVVWKKCFGGSGDDYGGYITKVQDQGYIFIGRTGSLDGDLSGVHTIKDSSAVNAIWVIRTDKNRTILLSKNFGGTNGIDNGIMIKPTKDGGFICGANMRSTNYDGTGNHGAGGSDIWLAKLDSVGTIEWSKMYGGSANESLGNIELISDGGYLAVGTTNSNNGDVSGLHVGSNNSDAWIVRTSNKGQIIWQKCIGGSGIDEFRDVISMPDNSYITIGTTNSKDGDITQNKGLDDVLVAKISGSGNLLWQKVFGGTHNDYGRSILSLSDNEFVLLNTTQSNDLDVSGKTAGSFAIWLVKLGNSSTIKGTVYYDENSNGIKEVNEKWANNITVTSSKSNYQRSAITQNGLFTIEVDTGSYTSKVNLQSAYYNVVPAIKNTTFTSYFQTDSFSFALQPIPNKQDLVINAIPLMVARPGFNTSYKIVYKNIGTAVISSGEIIFKKDSRLNFISSTPTISSSNGDTLKWNYANFNPGDTASITINFTVKAPPTVNNGDTLTSVAIINPVTGDETVADNTSTIKHRVTGSFDPNDKYENNGGVIRQEHITNGEYLNYTIRFQNTGTDTAFTVVVRDTLDSKVDPNTLQMVASSHAYHLAIADGNKLTWTFSNINLPDSNRNERGSHGYIAYRIKPKATVAVGDTIHNTASIYFDYNLPVITNNAFTTVQRENIALPLKLISFTGTYRNGEALLSWTTQGEYDFEKFVIERSTNGSDYSSIGTKKAAGTAGAITSYSFKDDLKNEQGTRFYYRLQMVDRDGKVSYSRMVMLHKEEGNTMVVYPNPVANGSVSLLFTSATNDMAHLKVLDMSGKIIWQQSNPVSKGDNTIHLPKLATLLPGMYSIQVETARGTITKKISIVR